MADAKGYLGRGWKFPVSVNRRTGRIETSEYEDDIKEAISIILQTRRGERVMLPEFGCDIYDFMFGLTDYTTLVRMENVVIDALTRWEPRISDIEVRAVPGSSEDGRIDISVSYVVRTTNNPFNLVFPYYLSEGINT